MFKVEQMDFMKKILHLGIYNMGGDDLDGDGNLEPAGANPLWHVLTY